MSQFMIYALVPLAIVAVAVVLVLGLVNMMRGGSPHPIAEADAAARAAAVRRDHRDHADDLGDGPVGRKRWSFSTGSTRARGDDGTTALGNGERRKKYDLRVATYGTLDEVNAVDRPGARSSRPR